MALDDGLRCPMLRITCSGSLRFWLMISTGGSLSSVTYSIISYGLVLLELFDWLGIRLQKSAEALTILSVNEAGLSLPRHLERKRGLWPRYP